MKKWMTFLTALCIAVALIPAIPAQGYTYLPFDDVQERQWFYEPVCYAYEEGLMNGVEYDRFDPDSPLTRGMFVTILGRIDGIYPQVYNGSRFTDVQEGSWYCPYIQWASENGIVTGYGSGLFGPEDYVTREQMATMIARYLEGKEITLVDSMIAVEGFADADAVSSWAQEGLELMRSTGIINGDAGNFRPMDNASRAEAATIFMRLHQRLQNTSVVPEIVGEWVLTEFLTEITNGVSMEELLGESYATLGASMSIGHDGTFSFHAGEALGGSGVCAMEGDYYLRYQITSNTDRTQQSGTLTMGGENTTLRLIMHTGSATLYWERSEDTDLEWMRGYREYVMEDAEYVDTMMKEFVEYQLLYLDEDEIPELYIDYGMTAMGNRLLSWQDGHVVENIIDAYSGIYYLEKENSFLHTGGRMGVYFDRIEMMDRGKLWAMTAGVYQERFDENGFVLDENGENVYDYFWGDVQVDQAAYYAAIRDAIDLNSTRSLWDARGKWYSYYEILTHLNP